MRKNLSNMYEEYEKERMAILSEAEGIETWAKINSNQDLVGTCKTTKVILEGLRIDFKNMENMEHGRKEVYTGLGVQEKHYRKCRYYNRGFCKYGRQCKFYHPKLVCSEYLRDGICLQIKCPKRHPRHCRHWTSKTEGCNRNETCQYLHIRSKRFSGDVTNNRTPLPLSLIHI